MTNNRVSATLSPEDRQAVMDAIATLKKLMPFLVHLTKEERKSMPKAGDRGRGFLLNCLDAAQQHTDCLPRSFDVAEMQKDVQLLEALYPVKMGLAEVLSLIEDTYFAAESEAYVASLKVYDALKSHADEPGKKIVVDQLKPQFARRTKKESAESAPDPESSTIA